MARLSSDGRAVFLVFARDALVSYVTGCRLLVREGHMAKSEYTLFEGDINQARVELLKASQDGRKPVLMNSQTYYTGEGALKRLVTTYSIMFEKEG
jgi:hypothetical protein